MRLTLHELNDLVGGTLEPGQAPAPAHGTIEGAAGLLEATETDVSFLANNKYINAVYETRAGAILIGTHVTLAKKTPAAIIRVARPDLAFARILGVIEKERKSYRGGIDLHAVVSSRAVIGKDVFVGTGAVISDGAHIKSGAYIGALSYIGKNCQIGSDVFLHPRVTILDDIIIGDRVIMHSGCVLGSDGFGFVTNSGTHTKIPQIGTITIGNDVEIGSNVSIDRGTTGATTVGSGTKIDNLVHIAHNVKIGMNCLIVAQVGISGSTIVGNNVTLAGQAGIVGHITIGDNAVVAAQSGVIGNVPPGTTVSGYPARTHHEAMKILGYIQKLPALFKELRKLKNKTL
jgi:UDP-3-O-[3-hydroxymyristoyl] glucosamine N-acyltransferase